MLKLNLALAASILVAGSAIGATRAQADTQAYFAPQSVEFFVNGDQEFPEQVFYSCDEIESRATELLQTLGATQINVDCQGGIDPFGSYSEPHVSLSFNSLQTSKPAVTAPAVSAQFTTVRLQGAEGCDLTQQLLGQVKGLFDVQSMTGDTSCMSADSPYSLTLTILVSR